MWYAYIDDGYVVDGYVYQPVTTSVIGNGVFALGVSESFAFSDNLSKMPAINKSELFAFAEARVSDINVAKAESFAFVEANSKLFEQRHVEVIAIEEAPSHTFGKLSSEAFAVAEARTNSVGLNQGETFAVAESCLRSADYIRNFAETLAIAETLANNFGLRKSEAFAIVDAWRRQGDMVISDMILASGNVTMEDFIDFMSYGNMPGYEKWRDFIPGDYEYREAMFRVVLESKNADRGLLTNLQATIDVPDMIDRGSATVVNNTSGAYVAFNRVFHIVPEITLASRSGSGTNPIAAEFYGTPTKTGFTARLRDTVTGAYVTGSFTWAAHGY